MLKKVISICLLFVMTLSLAGCGSHYSKDYHIGLIYTTEYKDKTKICFLDDGMKEKNTLSYNYPNISYDGFCNSCVKDNKLFLLPKGKAKKLDFGKVIALHLSDGKINEYDFNRTNITDFFYDNEEIYICSNLNGISYLEQYNNKNIETMEIQNCLLDTIAVLDGRIFGFISHLDDDKYSFCEFNISAQEYNILLEMNVDDSPCFLEVYKDKLYFAYNNILYEYDTTNDSMSNITLPHNNAFNLTVVGDDLYIAYTDLFEEKKSYIEVMHLPEKEIVKSMEYNGSILQLEVSKTNPDIIYLMDYENLMEYDISGEVEKMVNKIHLQSSGDYFVGGFFLNETENN